VLASAAEPRAAQDEEVEVAVTIVVGVLQVQPAELVDEPRRDAPLDEAPAVD